MAPLSDAEIKTLSDQGYKEGDVVPGRGLLLPDGTFKTEGSSPNTGYNPNIGYTTPGGATKSPFDTNDFLKTITDRLLSSSGVISSTDTNIEKMIKEAMGQVETSRLAGEKRIDSAYGRNITEARELGERERASFLEGGRGFAQNSAALKSITDTADKRVKDLEMRREELVLSGNINAANSMTSLIMKELEFEQDARQKAFTNLLGLGGFGLKIAEAAQTTALKASEIETFVDASGNVVAKNKLTGQTMWTAKGIGRSGSASPNLSVQPIADPRTGNVRYIEIRNKDDGSVTYKNPITGVDVNPSEVKIDEGQGALDSFLEDTFGELFGGGLEF